jgi:hypothetical protein
VKLVGLFWDLPKVVSPLENFLLGTGVVPRYHIVQLLINSTYGCGDFDVFLKENRE